MALVLFLERRRLPAKAKRAFQLVGAEDAVLYVPAVVAMEVGYLSERGRIDLALAELFKVCHSHSHIEFIPLDLSILESSFAITDISELHDRLIAGTARHLDFPLLTNDPDITASQFVKTIW